MDVKKEFITDEYALYCSDNMKVMSLIPDNKIHLSAYSPPFMGLYNYSSDARDHSNCIDPAQFFEQYRYVVRELFRITKPGCMTAVHCMDVPQPGNILFPLPDEIRRIHKEEGWHYHSRHMINKEPLRVAIRTRAQGLRHSNIVKNSTECRSALGDEVIIFKKPGDIEVPVTHPAGLTRYAGSNPPDDTLRRRYANVSNQTENKWSHSIWRKYADFFWDDIRIDEVLEYRPAKDADDEKHVHPLQLDVIDRIITLYSNPGDIVLSPYAGVGSEVYGAVMCGRKAIGIELKESYFNQSIRNLKSIQYREAQLSLFKDEIEPILRAEKELSEFGKM